MFVSRFASLASLLAGHLSSLIGSSFAVSARSSEEDQEKQRQARRWQSNALRIPSPSSVNSSAREQASPWPNSLGEDVPRARGPDVPGSTDDLVPMPATTRQSRSSSNSSSHIGNVKSPPSRKQDGGEILQNSVVPAREKSSFSVRTDEPSFVVQADVVSVHIHQVPCLRIQNAYVHRIHTQLRRWSWRVVFPFPRRLYGVCTRMRASVS